MKKYLFILLVFLSSCQKQSPSELAPDYADSLSEVRRGESCKKVNLLENIFELENLRDLFVCTTWEKSFPLLASALNEIEPSDWDYLSIPLNNHFFNDRDLRDQFIVLTRELDRKGGLDELGKVITSLSDSNFFYHVNLLFSCVNDDSCRQSRGITEEDLLNFYEFFLVEEPFIEQLGTLMRSFSTALKGQGASFKLALNENLRKDSFVYSRNNFLNEIFLKMGEDDFLKELAFYENLIFQEGTGLKGWLPSYIDSSLTKDEFNYLNRYPVDVHKDLWKDFRILRQTLDVSVGCKYEDGSDAFNVDISTHLVSFIDILFSSDQSEFFRNSLQSVAILKAANEVCPELREYRGQINGLDRRSTFLHEVNFVDMMEKTTKLMLESKYYTIVREIHKSRPNLETKDNTFLIRYFSDNIFTSYIEMLRASTPSLSQSLYDLIVSFPEAGYPALKTTFNFLREKDPSQLKGFATIWKALGEEGRFFFFNFLDAHYEEQANLPLLFDFYAAMVLNAKGTIPTILREIIDRDKKEEFLGSIQNITKVLGRAELLEEYRRFFSRGHLLEMLRVISSGSAVEVAGASLGNYILETPERDTSLKLPQEIISRSITKDCLEELVRPESTFYALLVELPVSCLPLRGQDPLFRFFDETSQMARSITESSGNFKVFRDKGFFSPGMITNVTQILNSLSKEFTASQTQKEGINVLLEELSIWVKEGGRKGDLVESFRILPVISRPESDILGVMSRFYGAEGNHKYLGNILKNGSKVIDEFQNYHNGVYDNSLTKENYTQVSELKCANFHGKTGGRPCPNKEELKTVINRVIKRSLKKHDGNPSALEQLLKMVATDYGLPIPFESESPRFKRVSLIESFEMFYGFTNKGTATNNFVMKYRPIPKADDEYFSTEDWKVTRKHAKDSPKPYEITVNTMERIEIVIRDVRFDENYLGAHYMNSVAKARDYNKVVDSKYGLLKTCIPLKFCGKFMNKGQHEFAKNSRETFVSLLDANTKEGWRHGDYMQSLLTSLVSSSPTKAQLSTIVNKRVFGLNIEIPWLNAKKTLRDHNGKILGLASMVGMFTNSARVLRDRVARTQGDFNKFIKSERLKKSDDGLLRNLSIATHLPQVEKLLEKIQDSEILDDFLGFVYESDYNQQRLWEQIIFKGVYVGSYLSDNEGLEKLEEEEKLRYQNLSLFDFLPLINPIIDNYKNITKVFNIADKKVLLNLNHFLDVLILNLEKDDNSTFKLLHEAAFFLKFNEADLIPAMNGLMKEEQLGEVKIAIDALGRLMPEIVSGKKSRLKEVLVTIENDDNINWEPLRTFLQTNGAKNLCSEETTGYFCRNNPEYRELQMIVDYVFGQSASNFSKIISYITGAQRSVINQFLTKVFPSINTGH